MTVSTQFKFTMAIGGLLVASTTYAIIQHQSLQERLDNSAQQCELQAQAVLDNRQGPKIVEIEALASNNPVAKADQKVQAVQQQAKKKTEEKAHLKDQPKLQRFNETLEDIVKRKYRFLLSKLDLTAGALQPLIDLLIRREELSLELTDAKKFPDLVDATTSDVSDLEYQIELVDKDIEDFLSAHDLAERYSLLKESDNEQEEFSQYTLGITSLFPLDVDQQEHVLLSKLKHKQHFESALEELGFNSDYPLEPEQQAELLKTIDAHATTYMNNFLSAVKPHIDHSSHPMDQYTLLENYTKTEFQQLRDKLKKQLESRGD